MKRLKIWVIAYFVSFFSLSNQSLAGSNNLNILDWNSLSQQILKENPLISNKWLFEKRWSSWPCDGSYRFTTSATAHLDQIKLIPRGERIFLESTLRDPYLGVRGGFRAPLTVCATASGWLGISADFVDTKGTLTFEPGGTLATVKVKITETRLGTLHFGAKVPNWFERFVTDMANAAFRATWSSFLGDWINKRLTEEVQKKASN